MPSEDINIINKLGLHARASAKLTQLAGQFPSEIFLSKGGRKVNAKSCNARNIRRKRTRSF